jgi:hypothetical protein
VAPSDPNAPATAGAQDTARSDATAGDGAQLPLLLPEGELRRFAALGDELHAAARRAAGVRCICGLCRPRSGASNHGSSVALSAGTRELRRGE